MATAPQCAHEACTCVPIEGEFCSDYCRQRAGHEEVACGCNHLDCAGTTDAREAV